MCYVDENASMRTRIRSFLRRVCIVHSLALIATGSSKKNGLVSIEGTEHKMPWMDVPLYSLRRCLCLVWIPIGCFVSEHLEVNTV